MHREFLDILPQQNLQQLVNQSTHIYGNTLDIICTKQLQLIHSHNVNYIGLIA